MNGNSNRLHLDPSPDYTAADAKLLAHIAAARRDDDHGALARMVMDYYTDATRAARMPRQLLYFHIGMLCTALAAAAGEPMDD